ncbi:MAG TPA: hypothetical protein DCF73_09710, partial [Rhodobiaceae bacterium]|nr:hypothetical protein [Rhodobiaceae bacterium]
MGRRPDFRVMLFHKYHAAPVSGQDRQQRYGTDVLRIIDARRPRQRGSARTDIGALIVAQDEERIVGLDPGADIAQRHGGLEALCIR